MSRACTRGLPFRFWPESDRALWDTLTQSGDLFDMSGPLSGMRPASLEKLRTGYGFFLGFVQTTMPDLLSRPPRDRVTEPVLRAWLASLEGLAPVTVAGYFSALTTIMTTAYADTDWSSLKRARARLHRRAKRAGGSRSKTHLPSAGEVVAFGRDLLRGSEDMADARKSAEAFRDGLMILVFIHHPMRIRNFAALDLGRTLIHHRDGFEMVFSADETKQKRWVSWRVAEAIAPPLRHYLDVVRPTFPGHDRPALWLRHSHGPWTVPGLRRHLARLCATRFEGRITPHNFRDIAATSVALSETVDARVIRPLMTHSSPLTAERHYNQADQLSSARTFHAILEKMR